MIHFDDARAGEFLQTKPSLSVHSVLNYLVTKPVTFHPSAIITRAVQFPDVSFYQGNIDYSVMCMQTEAIIIRAGQGIWKDEKFERNYQEARKCNKKIGVYWFYDGRYSPQQQVETLLPLLIGKKLEMEVYMDWEKNYGGAHEGLRNVVALMELIETAGYKVGFYTGYYFFRSNSNAVTHASQYNYLKTKPLWLGWYTSNPADVLIPAPWSELTHWQFGTPAVDWGQETKEIDMNFFNGTKQEFESRYGDIGEPPMADYVKLSSNTTSNRSIRQQTAYPQTPHILGAYIVSLIAGMSINAEPQDFYVYASNITYNGVVQAHAGDKWWKVPVAGGIGWIAEIHKGERLLTVEYVNEPTPPTLPTLIVNVSDTDGLYIPVQVELKPK
jgi:GH25 family lysozyme M1 (1,4-beta-N-acetylmuramidase)